MALSLGRRLAYIATAGDSDSPDDRLAARRSTFASAVRPLDELHGLGEIETENVSNVSRKILIVAVQHREEDVSFLISHKDQTGVGKLAHSSNARRYNAEHLSVGPRLETFKAVQPAKNNVPTSLRNLGEAIIGIEACQLSQQVGVRAHFVSLNTEQVGNGTIGDARDLAQRHPRQFAPLTERATESFTGTWVLVHHGLLLSLAIVKVGAKGPPFRSGICFATQNFPESVKWGFWGRYG